VPEPVTVGTVRYQHAGIQDFMEQIDELRRPDRCHGGQQTVRNALTDHRRRPHRTLRR